MILVTFIQISENPSRGRGFLNSRNRSTLHLGQICLFFQNNEIGRICLGKFTFFNSFFLGGGNLVVCLYI